MAAAFIVVYNFQEKQKISRIWKYSRFFYLFIYCEQQRFSNVTSGIERLEMWKSNFGWLIVFKRGFFFLFKNIL